MVTIELMNRSWGTPAIRPPVSSMSVGPSVVLQSLPMRPSKTPLRRLPCVADVFCPRYPPGFWMTYCGTAFGSVDVVTFCSRSKYAHTAGVLSVLQDLLSFTACASPSMKVA